MGNMKKNYMIMTQDLAYNSILGLHLERGMVSSVNVVSLVGMVIYLFRFK